MRRALRAGQVYTSHDRSELYREIVVVSPLRGVFYRTNRSATLQQCSRKTFIEWIRVRKGRKTQKRRRREL